LALAPMSAENVDVVRAACGALIRGDLHAIAEHLAEEIVWVTPDSLPFGGTVRGRAAVLSTFARLPHVWSEFSSVPDEYIDAGEHVLVRGVQRAMGAGGGCETRFMQLFLVQDGKIVRGEYVVDTAATNQAVGEKK
jgi:uncharacterized protein